MIESRDMGQLALGSLLHIYAIRFPGHEHLCPLCIEHNYSDSACSCVSHFFAPRRVRYTKSPYSPRVRNFTYQIRDGEIRVARHSVTS